MRAIFVFATAAAALLLAACDFEDFNSHSRYSHDFHYSYPLKADGRLSLETFNGSVEIGGWQDNTVDISGTAYGPTQEAADTLHIDVDHSADSVSVRAVRPSERRNNQGARFVVKIPRGVRLERITASNGAIRAAGGAGPAHLKTSNGPIHVDGLHGGIDAETSNSGVNLAEIDGDVEAHTSNGPIDLAFPGPFGHIRAHTSNSSVTLRMHGEPNARVSARTSNSSISSDFELRVQGAFNRNHMDTVLGSGGPSIDLETSNGPIRLLRR
jgi:hypothetical protein